MTETAGSKGNTGPLTLKERQRQERLELILQATEKALMEKGYHEMSLDEIAAEVGIAKATIYLHFPSKEELVISLLKRILETGLVEMRQLAAKPIPARERMQQILALSYRDKKKDRGQLFLALFAGSDLRKDAIEKKLDWSEHSALVMATLRQVLEDGKAAGEINPAIPTWLLQTTYIALLVHPGRDLTPEQEGLDSEERAAMVMDLYFNGIGNQA